MPAVADSWAKAETRASDALADGEFPLQPLLLPTGEHRHRQKSWRGLPAL